MKWQGVRLSDTHRVIRRNGVVILVPIVPASTTGSEQP